MRKNRKNKFFALGMSAIFLWNMAFCPLYAVQELDAQEQTQDVQDNVQDVSQELEMQVQDGTQNANVQNDAEKQEDEIKLDAQEEETTKLDVQDDETTKLDAQDEAYIIEREETKTEVKDFEQASFSLFEQEVANLIASYDNQIDGDKIAQVGEDENIVSRRLIVKGDKENLDFSSVGADVVINGPDNVSILQFSTQELAGKAKAVIEQMSGVVYCEADGYDYLEVPNVSVAKEEDATDYTASEPKFLTWGTQKVFADRYAKHLPEKEEEVIVAVVDTGVDLSHPFFAGKLCLDDAYNYVGSNANVQDDNGHGTHVSGILADAAQNINVKILPIKCMDAEGGGSYINVANAIRRAADAGAKVINYSAVGSHSQYKEDAINYAIQKGVTVVAASGNDNRAISVQPACPAHIEQCIVVGAVDEEENRYVLSNYGKELDIVAPGVDIRSCYLDGQYAYMTGTSMAAPYVSAAAAMLKLSDSSLIPAQIEQILKEYAKDLGDAGFDEYYGHGILDLSNLATHDAVEDAAVEPTCETTGLTRGSHCAVCSIVMEKQEEIPKLGHSYEKKITKATTSKNGKIEQKCKVCGKTKKETIYYPKTVTLSTTNYTYTGKTKTPAVTVTDAAKNKISDANYTVSYPSKRVNAGTYEIVIKFKGDLYSGTLKKKFYINKASQEISGENYTKKLGSSSFSLSGVKRVKGDGALSYSSSKTKVATVSKYGKVTLKSIGKTTITITAAETKNYKKTKKKITVKVRPATMKINSVKTYSKGSFTLYWTRNRLLSAYQIQYGTKSDFSDAKTVTIKSPSSSCKTICKLKAGKKYYIRLRGYKKVDGEIYRSLWSSTKTITTRKK